MSRSPQQVLEDSAELYERKNEDYGDSWRLTGKILATIVQHQGEDSIEIPADPKFFNLLGLYTRRLDKLVRSFNGTFMRDELEVDEPVVETVEDQAPYAAMQTALLEEFSDPEPTDGVAEEEAGSQDDMERAPDECPDCGKVVDKVEDVGLAMSEVDLVEYRCGCGRVWLDEKAEDVIEPPDPDPTAARPM